MSPRVLSTQATMPPMPPGGLMPQPTGEWLENLVAALNADRVQVGDRIERRVIYGPTSDFPTARGAGDLYYDTTVGYFYVDTGTWDVVGAAVASHNHDDRYYTETEVDGLLHAESHTIASHNDTTGTGAELDELTDGSTTTLHNHTLGGHTHIESDITDLDHDDLDAIHDNVAGEIQALTGITPADADKLLLEDESASYAKRRTSMSNIYSYVEGKLGGPFLPLAGGTMTGIATFGTGAWVDLKTQPTTPAAGIVSLGRTSSGDVFRMVTVDGYMDFGPTPGAYCVIASDLDDLQLSMDLLMTYQSSPDRRIAFEDDGSSFVDAIVFDTSPTPTLIYSSDDVLTDIRGSATRPTYKGGELALLSDTGGVGSLISHTDTPASFTGQGLKLLRVNSTPDAVEFVDGTTLFSPVSHTHLEADVTDLDHDDTDAIHDNVSGEIAALSSVALAGGDSFLIEDITFSNAKRRVTGAGIGTFIQDNYLTATYLPLTAGSGEKLTGPLYMSGLSTAIYMEIATSNWQKVLYTGTNITVGYGGKHLTLECAGWIYCNGGLQMTANPINMMNGQINMGTGNIVGDYGSVIYLKDSGGTSRAMCWMSGLDRIFGNTDGGTTWVEGAKLRLYTFGYSGSGVPNTSNWATAGSWGIHVQSSTGKVFLAYRDGGTVKAVELVASPYHLV